MESISSLLGKTIGIDTSPIIYFIEKGEKFYKFCDDLFREIDRKNIRAVTSALTITEVLVKPMKMGNVNLAREYK